MRLLTIALLASFCSIIFGQDDYLIHVNDTVFDLSLDQEYQVMLNQELVTIKLQAKDTLYYEDQLYSFKYLKDYKVSKMKIEEGIEQIILMTAGGSGIIIQQYVNLNPTALNEMMINEVTKESLNYGFQLSRKDYKRELISGQKIDVDKAVLKYKDEVNIYEIATLGNKDEGILIMTIRMDENLDVEGQKIIELMWNTISY